MPSLREPNTSCEMYENRGIISKVQKYSTKDGPGIRTTVFFKGCPLHCLWCANPELISPRPEILFDRSKCMLCGTCTMACPEHAIVQEQGKIHIKKDVCSGCGKCAQVCPMGVHELIGRYVSVEELVEELIKDKVFYEVSGGGVTFSGGEPALQHKFLKQMAVELKKKKIHIALDTSGSVSWDWLEEILNFIDLVLYDIKAMDEETHKKCTGADNRLILENAVKISELKIPMIVRFVMVPDYNDSEKDVKARLEFVKNLRSVQKIDILPYHRLGVAKYERLGIDYVLNDVKPPSEEHINQLKSFIESYGYKAAIGG